eukprot:15361751-Ditylum_brightwellii.AAC.1
METANLQTMVNPMGQIVRAMWDNAQVRWKAQNNHRHNDKHLGCNTTKTAIIEYIHTVYTHQYKLLEQDQFPFSSPLEQWPQKSISSMKLWLKQNIPFTN